MAPRRWVGVGIRGVSPVGRETNRRLFSLWYRMSKTVEIAVGPYRFTIVDTLQQYGDRILGRTFKMGGTYPDCVNVSIRYDGQKPVSASIPHVLGDPECSKGVPLDRGGGSVLMIKALLRHIHQEIPTLTRFKFDDMSHIECGTEEEQRSRRNPKKGSYAKPIPLNYFSIAFNGYTWYEKNFNATYMDDAHHAAYRARVKSFLTEEKLPPFADFLQGLSNPSALLDQTELLREVEAGYAQASTFQGLFDSLPKARRCAHARAWLISFVAERLKGVFSHYDWFMDVTTMDRPVALLGGSRLRGRRRTRRRGKRAYEIPHIRREGGYEGHSVGVDPMWV